LSQRATELIDESHDFVRLMMNGTDGEVILGPSTSILLEMLAGCYAKVLRPGSEIIVAETGHEANVGPWKHLDRLGFTLRWWEMDPATFRCPISNLEELLSEQTALVAFPHVSNLLGEIVDVEAITSLVHSAGARVVVDGVAYAPHRAMDISAWNVDWYAYSTYKVYGRITSSCRMTSCRTNSRSVVSTTRAVRGFGGCETTSRFSPTWRICKRSIGPRSNGPST
jgi:selenocysteine lyase/cysteine desulfurase